VLRERACRGIDDVVVGCGSDKVAVCAVLLCENVTHTCCVESVGARVMTCAIPLRMIFLEQLPASLYSGWLCCRCSCILHAQLHMSEGSVARCLVVFSAENAGTTPRVASTAHCRLHLHKLADESVSW
jgi:hypothetical protein